MLPFRFKRVSHTDLYLFLEFHPLFNQYSYLSILPFEQKKNRCEIEKARKKKYLPLLGSVYQEEKARQKKAL